MVAQSYRPWRSTVAQIYTVEAAITVKNATLWATNANGGGISLDAKLDSALYKQPDNGPASSGIWGKITGGASKALEAVKAFTDTAGAMAAWAGIKYSTSINVGSNARLVSNSDISVKASNTVKVELSPLVAKIAGIAVGVLESYSRVTIDGRLVAAKSITVRADSDQSLTISLTPGQIGAVPAVIGVGVSVVLSDASVHIGSGARLETGLRATVDPYTYVASGVGGDVTVAAQTKHKVGISISVSGSMAESDDKVVPPASGSTSTGPAQESGKYDAKYAKVGAAVGFAYSQVNTEVFMDGVIVARDAGKVLVQALTLDGGSAISVKTILGGRAATGGDYASKVQYEAKSAVIGKVATPISGAVTKGLGTGTQYVKSFFGALVEDSNSRTFKEKLRDVKAKKDAQKIIDYDKDIQKEIDKPSTEFQVGAALGMAINNFSTTVRIGDGQNAAQITTAGGAVQVEARSNYNTKFTVMSGVDDKVVADKQSFLKRRTTSPPTRSSAMSDRTVPTLARRRRWWSASTTSRRRRAWPPTPAFPPGRRRLRVGAEPEPDRPEQALAGQPVRAVRRHRGQVEGGRRHFGQDGRGDRRGQGLPEQSPGHAEQHGRHLVQLQQLGQRDRQEQEAGAVGGFFHRRAIDPDPHDRGGPHRHARRHGRRGRQCRHQGAEFDPAHEPGGQHHPAVDVDRRREIAEAGARPRKDAGPAGLRQGSGQGFFTPKVDGFDYGSQSKDGSAIGVSVYVNVATTTPRPSSPTRPGSTRRT